MTVLVQSHLMVLRRLSSELPKYRYRFSDEKDFQDGIARVLDAIGIPYLREHPVPTIPPPRNDRRSATQKALEEILDQRRRGARFDFWLEQGLVIEVKIKGSFAQAAGQVARYCRIETVKSAAIVTSLHWPPVETIGDKPVAVINVQRAIA